MLPAGGEVAFAAAENTSSADGGSPDGDFGGTSFPEVE